MATFNRGDLDFVLTQIEMAEAGQPPVNPLLSFGLRTVSGIENNAVPGQAGFGSVDRTFPTVTAPLLQSAQFGTSYTQTNGFVIDAQPRLISNLIADQTADNAAAVAAQAKAQAALGAGYQNTTLPGPDGIFGTADDIVSGNPATPTDASNSSSTIPGLAQSLFINNVTPDNGLSAPFSSWFTFFGQFFDHGLDLIAKGGNGIVYIPLSPDDPLYVVGGHSNFMILTRATDLPGADGILGTADDIHAGTNGITPFVDQSQTYASHPSHQVFLRDYMIGADGALHSSGALLDHHTAGADGIMFTADDTAKGLATWGDLKAQALIKFGIRLSDADVGNVPLLATDDYGNFIPGAHGLPQMVKVHADGTTYLVEGNLANPIDTTGAVRIGIAFINDMNHAASPFDDFGNPLLADPDTIAGNAPAAGFYDNELLDAHYVAGDGRVNENIGLTAVHDIFHSEHNRQIGLIKALVQSQLDIGDTSFAANWVLPGVDLRGAGRVIQDSEWNGERLFQAAKFATETQYQHLVFEEFARKVDPNIHVFGGVNVHLDPAIVSEFANVVYRFGHSMLDENINIYQVGADGTPVLGADGKPLMSEMGLIQAFTNPLAFANNPNATADIILGSVNQVGNEIDEFVTGSLRNNLLGLPLDLPALNIARGRDTGVAPLNLVRAQLYAATNDVELRPYKNWDDFGHLLKHPESLVNFIAAYGTHASIVNATTLVAKRAAAEALVHKGTIGDPAFNPVDPASLDAYNFMHSAGAYTNDKLNPLAIHDAAGAVAQWSTGSITGLDNVDLWIGGLAEKQNLFGGLLGSTFEYIFRIQLENLQDGDRLYYLPRIEGMNFSDQIESNSFAQLIADNTGAKHLPGSIFLTPEYTVEAKDYFKDGNPSNIDPANITDPSTWLHNPQTGKLLVTVDPDGTVRFIGDDNFLGNTIVLGGTAFNDRLTAGSADDDTIWADGGNDTVDGGGGNDILYGGDGNDSMIGGQGDDIIHGDAGNDTVSAGDGIDNVFGGDGADLLDGGRGDDAISGGQGNDTILGSEGNDELHGNEGDDWIDGGLGGDLLVGDIGAPTGQTPLYGGNDVLIGGPDGGDRMQGFNGDDIMLGVGSFDKFEGRLGFDWASYEQAIHGVDADLNRREFIAANGAEDTIRDFFIAVEGVSGSAQDDILKGSNNSKLLTTKDELDNPNLIIGLPSFFAPGQVTFDGGNIMLGGAGNDSMIGGGGDDIIEGDAWLHVGLSSTGADGQIIRKIQYDVNGNTWDPLTGAGHINAANVDTAVYNDVMANYAIAAFGPDAEGFLTIQHTGVNAVVGGNPQGLAGIDDGTDRIRHIERLQFSDQTVAIDAYGNILSQFDLGTPSDQNYDHVPIGVPTITEVDPANAVVDPATVVTVGNTLTANLNIFDADTIAGPINLQWEVLDVLRAVWVPIAGATGATFKPTTFQDGESIRVTAKYVDGKGYTETLHSAGTALTTLRGDLNTAPFVVPQQQLTGIPDTSASQGAPLDFFVPLTTIFSDNQQAANTLTYTASLSNGDPLASVGLGFTPLVVDPAGTPGGSGRFFGILPPDFTGPISVRVIATDSGGLSVTDTFVINVLAGAVPVATDDTYSTLENIAISVANSAPGVLANDSISDGDPLHAMLVTGAGHGQVILNTDGTFSYTPDNRYFGTDSFTYKAVDAITSAQSAAATVTLNVAFVDYGPPVTAALANDTGPINTDGYTSDPTLTGSGDPGAAVLASIDGALQVQVATAAADGSWSFTPVLADGNHQIVVGEISQPSVNGPGGVEAFATVDLTLDTIAPSSTAALVADTGVSASDGITSNSAITGVTDPFAILNFSIDGAAPIQDFANFDGTWTFSPAFLPGGLADGAHSIAVTAEDRAGNTSTSNIGFVLDTVANLSGAFSFSYATTGSTLDSYTIAGLSEPGATVSLTEGGVPVGGPSATAADGSFTFSHSPTPNNNLSTLLTVSASDIAGNIAVPTSMGLVVGTSAANTGATLLAPTAANAALPNAILGLAGNDSLNGGSGNDTLDGGAGADAMAGGTGDDTYVVDASTDVITEAPGAGTDLVLTTLASFTLGANLENLTYIGAATFNGTGNTLANVITGGAGNDILSGGVNAAGGDTLIGGAGNDTYNVSNAADIVTEQAGGGTDLVRTTLNAYTLGANLENLSFTGAGAFAGTGNELANSIIGGTGADILDGGLNLAGGDTLAGGAGNDTYTVRNAADVVTEAVAAGTDTVQTTLNTYTLGSNVENLTFIGTGDFAGTGTNQVNVITGGTGNDQLAGSANAPGLAGDVLVGGLGDDTYIVSNAADAVTENAGEGTDTVLTALAAVTLAANVENLTYTGGAAFAGTGNASANVITSGSGNDVLSGGVNTGAAGDTLVGGAGNDTYNVANTADVIIENAGGGTDLVRATAAAYALGANVENLTFTGAGSFAGTGNDLANVLTGGTGNDSLDGGLNASGGDTLIGGAGNDTYIVRNTAEVITETGAGGTDTVQTTLASYTLGATLENLTSIGAGTFSGTGNASANVLTGGAGNDTLNGVFNNAGLGGDTLIGGLGDDTYIVNRNLDVVSETPGGGTDTIRTVITTYALGANVENLTYTGANAFVGTGNNLANVITGSAAANTLTGGTNDPGSAGDTLIGGAAGDTYVVSNANDVIVELATTGTDTVRTGLGAWTIGANLENLVYTGTGSFAGTGNGLANSITGGIGNDSLDGGLNATGGDTLTGGAGDDTYTVRNAGDVIVEFGGGGIDTVLSTLNTFTLFTNLENLTFTGIGNFNGTGTNQSNILVGSTGNDTLNGVMNTAGLAGDTLIGGAGNDTYIVNRSNDVVTENAGGGTDTIRTAITTYTLASEVENLTFTGVAAFVGTGNASANVITGSVAAANTLTGIANSPGLGGDTLIGGTANDTYIVANSNDVIVEAANGGTDLVRASASAYTLGANVENLLYTGTGNFAGTGNSQANAITGGIGNDTLDGSLNATGGDSMAGGTGDDTYIVRNAADIVTENLNAGTDTVLAAINTYTLGNNVENLTFIGTGAFTGTGSAAANVITGGIGNDSLNGGANNDTLFGGAGADSLTGGTGNDTFMLAAGDLNGDLITDFSQAGINGVDHLTFTGYAAGAVLAKITAGSGATPTVYAVQIGGVTQDSFKLTGNVTLAAGSFNFA